MWGAVGRWMFTTLAGIDIDMITPFVAPENAAYAPLRFRPRVGETSLVYGAGRTMSQWGLVHIQWTTSKTFDGQFTR